MTKTVLIVEDNELNMKLFRDLLEAHGIATLETRNGMEVLGIAREKKPDLVLMDIQLPEVSGLDVTKWLKNDEALKSIPVIAVTAFAMKGDEEKIRQGGCEDYISKPISVSRFLEVIQTYLNKPKDEAETAVVEAVDADAPSFEIRDHGDEEDFESDDLGLSNEDEPDPLDLVK
ncbi:MAG: two-component system response regulator [Micavibrio aeruginosavorus]|uniref:Two-component system response regulator n=1 Tax=Micavibrio aeruginosavorus TaxID=349221 RepID=A0A2W5N1T4_9BACT|nr:MAG: two-component system response regulator [Micavibrio aeruginosavorus]